MTKIMTTIGAISVGAALVIFPASSFAHEGEPANAAKEMAKAMQHSLVVRGGKTAQVTIVHVQRGCHVWSNGTKTARGVKVFLRRGGRLTIRNQDVDMHRLVRLFGPRIALGGFVRMNRELTLTFPKRGVVRLRTKTKAMAGMPEMKTMGPDNPMPMHVVVK